jgi:hypothetical protein
MKFEETASNQQITGGAEIFLTRHPAQTCRDHDDPTLGTSELEARKLQTSG